ncbi:GerMN domain-containing protein [Dictyobacter arantiisoli]|uniref:GerMN domain-containing protein n=1 Tax=Dictyobacter arantiisoli TaxID=2014874 RepID=A0A5A5TI12_9CHLR|nr:GerMN domain-containing protein [Dictyobacter arantiisoli]GCF11027.1 hypothetical protein KDI_45910 [Dictyobacter arantiisoli]
MSEKNERRSCNEFKEKKHFSTHSQYSLSLALGLLLVVCILLLSACEASAAPSTTSTTPVASVSASNGTTVPPFHSTPTTAMTATPSTTNHYTVKIYFSKPNALQANDNLGTVFWVQRVVQTNQVATYALQQLINGPTASEVKQGYQSMLHNAISGKSTCAGQADFRLTLNARGPKPEPGTATLTLCHAMHSAGVGTDAGIQSEIDSTLTQFPTIKKVVILTSDKHCFGDESGTDHCLR